MAMRNWMAKCLIPAALVAALFPASEVSASFERTNTNGLLHSSRRLEDGKDDDGYDDGYFQYDLAEFSLRFEKCQYVKMFQDEMAEDEDSDSPLAMKHFVVYRLCPSDECETCDETYGKYVVDVQSYLGYTIQNQMEAFEEMCESCEERCNNQGSYCSGCGKLCYNYENLEELGYVDATEYIECQQLDIGDDDNNLLYIGPRCVGDGSKIKISLFSDENCWEPIDDVEPDDVLGAKISYHLLSHASKDDGSVCLSCMEDEEDQQDDDYDNADDDDDEDKDYDNVNEMCEDLYFASAKCESKTGLENGFIQANIDEEDYENQVENEFMACTFIDSLLWNSYTETGEIDIEDTQDVIVREATTVQKTVLSLLSVTILGLSISIYYIHKHFDEKFPNLNFMCNTDGHLT